MKTPEEIKKALKLCGRGCYSGCPYNSFECVEEMSHDALAYIQQLENQLREATEKVQKLEAAQPKWISVEERLPETNMRVAVLYRFPGSSLLFMQMLDYYATDPEPHFQYTLSADGPIVEYWMQLPEMRKMENA